MSKKYCKLDQICIYLLILFNSRYPPVDNANNPPIVPEVLVQFQYFWNMERVLPLVVNGELKKVLKPLIHHRLCLVRIVECPEVIRLMIPLKVSRTECFWKTYSVQFSTSDNSQQLERFLIYFLKQVVYQ